MDPSREYPTPSVSNPQPRQSKATTQKQYREKEGECFTALRDVIKQLTGEVLQTRQEILRKAIYLLLSLLEMRRQEHAEVNPSASYEMPVTGVSNLADTSSAQLAYPPQFYLPQPWQNTESANYTAQVRASEWQYPSMSNMDFPFEEQVDDEEFDETWSHDFQA